MDCILMKFYLMFTALTTWFTPTLSDGLGFPWSKVEWFFLDTIIGEKKLQYPGGLEGGQVTYPVKVTKTELEPDETFVGRYIPGKSNKVIFCNEKNRTETQSYDPRKLRQIGVTARSHDSFSWIFCDRQNKDGCKGKHLRWFRYVNADVDPDGKRIGFCRGFINKKDLVIGTIYMEGVPPETTSQSCLVCAEDGTVHRLAVFEQLVQTFPTREKSGKYGSFGLS